MIKPYSFDIDTCKEVTGDTKVRIIEADAREKADLGIDIVTESVIYKGNGSYFCKVQQEMQKRIWINANHIRLERNKRKQK